jgi:prevent-host-death family protein
MMAVRRADIRRFLHDPAGFGAWCQVDVATMRRYCSHVNVGVRSLKEHLSEYLERAARGETIVVTDRGEPKAMLGPVPGRLDLERGIAEKWIRAGSGEPPRPVRRFKPRLPTADALREDRGE